MTTGFAAEAVRLTEACHAIFGDPATWITADGYPDSTMWPVVFHAFVIPFRSSLGPVVAVVAKQAGSQALTTSQPTAVPPMSNDRGGNFARSIQRQDSH